MPAIDTTTPAFTRALADLRPTIEGLPTERLETIRLDIEAALVLALGVAPRARAFQEAARAQLGESFAAPFDRLEPAARACARAHADHLITLDGAEVDQRVAALGEKRAILLLEAQSLVQQRRMPASLLGELNGGTGYRDMAFDVLQLASAFRKEWASIEAHTPVTSIELDESEALANVLVTTLGENGQADASASPSGELRRRAYTLFVQTYEEVRRAVTYVRWEEGDVDQIIPSLFAGRARKRDEEDVIAPVPNGTAPIPPGMPGAPPFVS